MKQIKFLLGTLVVIVATAFIYSCAKDSGAASTTEKKPLTEAQIQELKESLGFVDGVETRNVTMVGCGNTTMGCSLHQAARKDTFLIPGTTCYAEATCDVYACYSFGSAIIITYVFNNFSAYPIDGMGCDSILNAWDSLYLINDFDELTHQLDVFNSIASEIAEANFFDDLFTNPFQQYIFDCNEFNTTLFGEFYIDNCFQYCVYYIIRDGRRIAYYQTSSCGESCCKRSSIYCWSAAQNKVIQSSPVVQKIGECEPTTPGEGCPREYKPLGQCKHQCFPKK